MLKKLPFLLGVLFILSGCSDYQKLLKSDDYDMKYEKAIEYYSNGDCYKAMPLFEELIPIYRLTDRGEKVYYYYAKSQYCLKDFYAAAFYFKSFARSYPNSEYSEECAFMSAICNTKISPESSLDQEETRKAISELQLFLNRYPNSEKKDTCHKIIDKLNRKLVKKDYDGAKQYYTMELYKAAAVSMENFLKMHPKSVYEEEALFIKLKSNFLLASNSIESKKRERYEETIKSYSTFVAAFPESDERKEADKMKEEAEKALDKLMLTEEN